MNDILFALPDFPQQSSRRTEEAQNAGFTDSFVIRIESTVTIGAGVAGVLRGTGSVAQLVSKLDFIWDSTYLFDISGIELRRLTQTQAAQVLRETRLASVAPGTYVLSGDYMITFARRHYRNPFETVLPPLPVRNQLRVGVEWDQNRSNAASAPGSSALITGGTSAVTFSATRVQIVQRFSKEGKAPYFIPIITSVDSPQFTAANPRLRVPLVSTRLFSDVLLHSFNGGDAIGGDSDTINYFSFVSGNDAFINRQDRDTLRSMVNYTFPAFPYDSGWLWMPMAAGGILSNAINPTKLANGAFEFDVSAPGVSPGVVRATFLELITLPGTTAPIPWK